MTSHLLGRSSLSGSRLVYGCWRIAGTQAPSEAGPDARKAGVDAVRAAWEAGYTTFDLADVYCEGVCEEIFGEALRTTPGLRDDILLVTKCGIRLPGQPAGAPYRYDFSGAYLKDCVDRALDRLGVDRIDVLLLHRPDFLMDPDEVARTFVDLRKAGKVAEFGVSNFRPDQLALLQGRLDFPMVAHQVEISLKAPAALENGILDQCLGKGITPMAWSPLGGAGISSFPEPAVSVLEEIASRQGVAPEAVALAWLLRHPAGIWPVIGTTRPDRIRALAAADTLELSREDWYRLFETARGSRLP